LFLAGDHAALAFLSSLQPSGEAQQQPAKQVSPARPLQRVEDRQLLNEIQRAADGPSTTTTNNDRNKLAGSSLVAQREPPQQRLVTSLHNEPVGPDLLILGSRCGPRPRCQWLDQSSRPRGTRPPAARHRSTHSTTEPCLSSILHPAFSSASNQGRPGARQQPQLSC
jgi:hypothetical protein